MTIRMMLLMPCLLLHKPFSHTHLHQNWQQGGSCWYCSRLIRSPFGCSPIWRVRCISVSKDWALHWSLPTMPIVMSVICDPWNIATSGVNIWNKAIGVRRMVVVVGRLQVNAVKDIVRVPRACVWEPILPSSSLSWLWRTTSNYYYIDIYHIPFSTLIKTIWFEGRRHH